MSLKSEAGKLHRIFVAGDIVSEGSCVYAWIDTSTERRQAAKQAGFLVTEHEAEAIAISQALAHAPIGAVIEMITDSELGCAKLNKKYVVQDETLARILRTGGVTFQGFRIKDQGRMRKLMKKRLQRVQFTYVPVDQNHARIWLNYLLSAR